MKDPAFLFYSADFIVGVQTMTFEDRGKYITILALMHQQGRMNEETIRFLVGSVSDNLLLKFQKDEHGMYFNARLEEEIEKRAHFVDSRRNNGKKGGRPKANAKPNGYPNGKPKNNLSEDVNENVIEDIDITKKGAKNEILKIAETLPDFVLDFVKHRQAIKKPFKTKQQLDAWLQSLRKKSNGSERVAREIVAESIANGWQGIFEPKAQKQQPQARQSIDQIHHEMIHGTQAKPGETWEPNLIEP